MRKRTNRLIQLAFGSLMVTWLAALVLGAISADANRLFNAQFSERNTAAIAQTVSDQERPCHPAGQPEAQFMGSEQGRHGLYQIWYYQEPRSAKYYRAVTMTFGEACGLSYSEEYGGNITDRIPLRIARNLTRSFYQNIIAQAGGTEAYQQVIDEAYAPEEWDGYIDPVRGEIRPDNEEKVQIDSVDLWALDQLGIRIPRDKIEIINIDDEWDYDYDPEATP